jgi:two-component system sensor histidine kinase YesM
MSSRTLEEDYINYQGKLNKQIVKTMEENFRNLTRQSMAVYANPDDIISLLASSDAGGNAESVAINNRVSNYLYSLLQSNDKVYAVTLLSLDGQVVYYSSKQGSSINLYNVREEPWFEETLALKGMPLLVEPHQKKYVDARSPNNKWVLSISRLIIDLKTGAPIGIIMFDQDLAQFSNIVSDAEWDRNQQFMVVGKNGRVVYSDPSSASLHNHDLSAYLPGEENSSFKAKVEAETLLVNSSSSESYGWRVITSIPLSELKKKSLFLRDINLFLLVILILLAFLLSIFFTYIVNIPLKKLLLSLRRLGKGDFGTRVAVRGEDEFSQIGLTFNSMVENIEHLIQQNFQMGLLKKQAELDSLQSQINPHFLFNTLSSILSVMDKKDFQKSSTMLRSLSDLFRYSLNRGRFIVPFQEELDNISKYLYIQECRFGNKYKVAYDIDDEVLEFGIVRLSLQPIVENAIIHGLEPKQGPGELKITAKAFGDMYYVYISDNGIGMDDLKLQHMNQLLEKNDENADRSQFERLGIFNVDARIKLHYGAAYGLRLYRGSRLETIVKIALPARGEQL